jgi:hypothetical protein
MNPGLHLQSSHESLPAAELEFAGHALHNARAIFWFVRLKVYIAKKFELHMQSSHESLPAGDVLCCGHNVHVRA